MRDYESIDASLSTLPWGPDGHDTEECTNGERAERAMRVLEVYEHLVWFRPDADVHETALGDLLSDIAHLCRRQRIETDLLFAAAIDMHDQEVIESEEGDMDPCTEGWENADG